MIRTLVLTILALGACVSCVSKKTGPYEPATKPEQIEFSRDRLDVYPDDVRKDLGAYLRTPVVWVGIIRSIDAHELDTGDKIRAVTVFEHHYFDWVEDGAGKHIKLAVSPRGEGAFQTTWNLKKEVFDATAESAEKFAGKGKLAIVYGTPEMIDTNGTVVLHYHYLRILGRDNYTTNDYDYGRLGEPFYAMKTEVKTNPPPVLRN